MTLATLERTMRKDIPRPLHVVAERLREEVQAKARKALARFGGAMPARLLAVELRISPHAIDHYLRNATGVRKVHRRSLPGEHTETWYSLDGLAGCSDPQPAP